MRSADRGEAWAKVESALPLHLEPSPLAQDRIDPNIVYAGFSLRPYNEAWRAAQQAAEQRSSEQAKKKYLITATLIASLTLAIVSAIFLRRRAIRQSPLPLGGEG